jgi:DNA-binding transcriptional MocR family regulator
MMSDKTSAGKRSRRLTDTIAEYLTTTIRDLAPGSKLPSEHQLAKHFGVSRSAVREAISAVASLGLLEIRKGAGMFARSPLVGTLQGPGPDYVNLVTTSFRYRLSGSNIYEPVSISPERLNPILKRWWNRLGASTEKSSRPLKTETPMWLLA